MLKFKYIKLVLGLLLIALLFMRAGNSPYYIPNASSIWPIQYESGAQVYILGPMGAFFIGSYDLYRTVRGVAPEDGEFPLGNSLLINGIVMLCFATTGTASTLAAMFLYIPLQSTRKKQYIFALIASLGASVALFCFVVLSRVVSNGARISLLEASCLLDPENYIWYGSIISLGVMTLMVIKNKRVRETGTGSATDK